MLETDAATVVARAHGRRHVKAPGRGSVLAGIRHVESVPPASRSTTLGILCFTIVTYAVIRMDGCIHEGAPINKSRSRSNVLKARTSWHTDLSGTGAKERR